MNKNIRFEKIDFDKDKSIAINFRADSFRVSFGSDRDFWGEDNLGGERYIDWLKQ